MDRHVYRVDGMVRVCLFFFYDRKEDDDEGL